MTYQTTLHTTRQVLHSIQHQPIRQQSGYMTTHTPRMCRVTQDTSKCVYFESEYMFAGRVSQITCCLLYVVMWVWRVVVRAMRYHYNCRAFRSLIHACTLCTIKSGRTDQTRKMADTCFTLVGSHQILHWQHWFRYSRLAGVTEVTKIHPPQTPQAHPRDLQNLKPTAHTWTSRAYCASCAGI